MTRLSTGLIAAAAAVAFVASVAFGTMAGAQEKKAPKAKSKCNAITEETACKADTSCIWIAASVDAKTGKQKRKAYCKTKSVPAKKAKEPPKDPKKK